MIKEFVMKKKGFTLIELLVVIAIIALLMGILMPALSKARALAIQLVCGTNLKGLGSAMLVYTSYCDDDYPRAGGAASIWSTTGNINDWAPRRYVPPQLSMEDAAFEVVRDADGEVLVPGGQGKATITSSFYLLIKHAKVTPKQFVCKGDAGTQAWKISEEPSGRILNYDMARGWDFGNGASPLPWPGEVESYSYQMPYSQTGNVETFVIVDMSNPGSPMAADRSPFADKVTGFTPEPGDNSASHQGKGQNVLYKDGHVKFEDRPTIGLGDDNIYTYRTRIEDDPTVGIGPTAEGDPMAYPLNESDALLLNERNGRTQ
jgi:prepilin-type N-terminal cleavage/methylation domain-containing protein